MSDTTHARSRTREIFAALNASVDDTVQVADLSTYLESIAPNISQEERSVFVGYVLDCWITF